MYAKETIAITTTLTETHGRTRKYESSVAVAANDEQTARRTRNKKAPQTERNYRDTVKHRRR
jgi:hypothetical protein